MEIEYNDDGESEKHCPFIMHLLEEIKKNGKTNNFRYV